MAENPSQDNMMRMQQEALRRVRSMQERARNSVRNDLGTEHLPETGGESPEETVQGEAETRNAPEGGRERESRQPGLEEKSAIASQRTANPGLLSLLSGGNSESILLLVLLLLLADEKADPALLMAVLYLIL